MALKKLYFSSFPSGFMSKLLFIMFFCLGASAVNAQSNKAFGDNMIEVEPGVWAIYSGDINQDLTVDLFDQIDLDNDITIGNFGYLSTDLNGDGSIDLFDQIILDNNLFAGVVVLSP